jgi:response regulator RpfG family c-di-GMP phosphodiesterase
VIYGDIPVVVIAIASDPTAMKQALNKRAHFTLQKPFTPELMTNTLKAGWRSIWIQ